jgi:hypothetical protein
MSEKTMRSLNLAFRFVLEMAVLVALFLFGVSVSESFIVQLVIGIGLPLLAMVVWGLFVAPKSARRLPDPARLVLESAVFGSGVLAFFLSGNVLLGILLGLAAAVSITLMFMWDQRAY